MQTRLALSYKIRLLLLYRPLKLGEKPRMNFSRRDFIKLGGIAAVTTVGFSSFALAQKQFDVLSEQTSDSLRQLIGTEFYFTTDNISTTVTLTNIKDFPDKTLGGQSFSMEFQVPLKSVKDDAYRIWHADLGNFDLYCVAGKNRKSRTLLATITRI